jgi:hypothetical protein
MRPASTQRWRDGTDSWHPAHEGGFNPDRFDVAPIDHAAAAAFVRQHHYAATWPSVTLAYALHDHSGDRPVLAGIIARGMPTDDRVLTNPFPSLVPNDESLEWSRLVLVDDVPANGESRFAARAFELAAAHGIRGIVTFADPLARSSRTPAGPALVKPGHIGIVYQALNMSYLGRATPRTLRVLPDGTVLTARAISKVRTGERGAGGVISRLVQLGAPRPDGQLDPAAWLDVAFDAIGAYRQRHPGNYRYAVRIGTRSQRTRTIIAMPAAAYPKPVGMARPYWGWCNERRAWTTCREDAEHFASRQAAEAAGAASGETDAYAVPILDDQIELFGLTAQ